MEEDKVVLEALETAQPSLTGFVEALIPRFQAGGRLIYVGAGTSGRLGVLDASEIPPTFHLPHDRIIGVIAGGERALKRSSEGIEDEPDGAIPELEALRLGSDDAVLGVAAGGTTPYVLGAVEYVRKLRPRPLTCLLVCSKPIPPPDVDHLILLETGPEVIAGSTRMKAGTATKLALNAISTTLMIRSGRVYGNLMVDLRATNDKLKDRGARIIRELTGLDREKALQLLERADGSVKTAVLMERLGISKCEAIERLNREGGFLDRALGE